MSDPEGHAETENDEDSGSKGPNLVLIYSLIALALAFAIGFAMMIVAPFHHRH
jgi:hypothetical protein